MIAKAVKIVSSGHSFRKHSPSLPHSALQIVVVIEDSGKMQSIKGHSAVTCPVLRVFAAAENAERPIPWDKDLAK